MRKLYFLCLLTLAAVILDITLSHSGSVSAQSSGQTVHVERVLFNGAGGDARITGRVVGFQCVDTSSGAECFVASGSVAGLDHTR